MPRWMILDLDGTLVDTIPDLVSALNFMARSRGFAPFDAAEVKPMVGDGVRALATRAFAARGRACEERDLDELNAEYTAHAAVASRPFPGVVEGLRRLRSEDWRLAVCTNKPAAPTRALLDALELSAFFDAVGAGDSFPVKKPDPGHLRATIAAAGGDPAHSAMVGDHRNDVLTAAGAGVPCVFAGWGYGAPEMAEGAAATARDFADACEIARRIVPEGG